MNALGMVEVFGFTTAICCADIAAKAADVKIIALDKNKPLAGDDAPVPLIMNVKMEGSVAAVEEAVNAAKAHAISKNLFVTSHVIPRPGIGTEKLAVISEVGRDRWIGDIRVEETKKPEVKKEIETKKDEKQIGISEIAPQKVEKAVAKEKTEATKEEAPKASETQKKPRGRRPKSQQ